MNYARSQIARPQSHQRFKRLISSLLAVVIVGNLSAFQVVAAANVEETTYYILEDHLGSIDVVMDEDANVVERRDYLPFGAERVTEREPNVDGEKHGFTGQLFDDETQLHYYGARYYDSELGRFASTDPWEGDLKNPQTLNKYSYVLNNPLAFTDPTGELPFPAIIGAIVGAVTAFLSSTQPANAPAPGDVLVPADPPQAVAAKMFVGEIAGNTAGKLAAKIVTAAVKAGPSIVDMGFKSIDELKAYRAGLSDGKDTVVTELVGEKAGASAEQLKNLDHRVIAPTEHAEFRDAGFKADAYGGRPEDYVKQSSPSYTATDGTSFEIHSVRNTQTDEVFELKTNITKRTND